MRSSTKSLLVTVGTITAITVTPLVLDATGGPAQSSVATVDSTNSETAPVAANPVRTGMDGAVPAQSGGSAPGAGTAPIERPGSSMGGDLPAESLPTPPYPQCPITDEGAWWTDPADPYTCLPPTPVFENGGPFHEPTPPGIDPELLEPIFEKPVFENGGPFHEPTPPGIDPELLKPIVEDPAPIDPAPVTDCRSTGALQCTVTIMGQNYVVTFADGKPVGVVEAR